MDRFILATSCAEPDREFGSIEALARAIDTARNAAPNRPSLRFIDAMLSRGPELSGGKVVAVRLYDGGDAGHGTLIGYAFMPGARQPARTLLSAIQHLTPVAA